MNETVADIIAEMRMEAPEICEFGNMCIGNYADRIEAAHTQEVRDAAMEYAVLPAVCISKHGDAVALREALKLCVREMCKYCRADAATTMPGKECLNGCEAMRIAKSALEEATA